MNTGINKRKYFVFLFIILSIGLFLRIYNLNAFGIWDDEKMSINIANGINRDAPLNNSLTTSKEILQKNTLGNVLKSTIEDNGNSIAYNILLHSWTKVFGNSDWSIRLLSAIASLLLLFVTYFFVRDFLSSHQAILLSLLFMALQPLLIAYSHQARAYSWAALFTFLSSWMFIKLFVIDKKQFSRPANYISYIVFGVLSLLTHYLTICIFISQALIFLFFIRKNKLSIYFFGSGLAIALIFGLWFYLWGMEGYKLLDSQNAKYANIAANFKTGDDPFIMPATKANIATGIMQVWLQLFGNAMQAMGFRIRELAATLIIPMSIIVLAFWKSKDRDFRKKILLLLLLTFTQTMFATLLAIKSGHCISFQPMYAIFVVPYAMMLLAYSFCKLFSFDSRTKLFSGIALVVWIAIMCISCYPILTDRIKGKERRGPNPYIKLAKDVEHAYIQGDTLVAPSSKDIYLLTLYFNTESNILQKADSSMGKSVYLIRQKQKDTLKLIDLKGIQY